MLVDSGVDVPDTGSPMMAELPVGSVLLETTRPDGGEGRNLLFRDPVEIVEIREPSDCGRFFSRLEAGLGRGLFAAGFFSYESGVCFEKLPQSVGGDVPLAWFGLYAEPAEVETGPSPGSVEDPSLEGFSLSREQYGAAFRAVKDHIREGDVYQINLTGKVRFSFEGDPYQLYRRLKQIQPVAYSAYIRAAGATIISLSPELFFRIDGQTITARPMKGTSARGRFLEEDERRRDALRNDPKTRAENLMIVDLLRNDLSRVCRPGSVLVPRLFEVETYPTVLQMTSTVTGELKSDVSPREIIGALFPCGSVTGAPKIRAMEIIHALEREPRGVYTGAIGVFKPGGDAVFSVAIRTVLLQGGRGEMGTGGGVVWDSDEETEYDECMLKAAFLTRRPASFQLIETMRWENGLRLLDEHLDRLERSAAYFRFSFDRRRIQQEIDARGRQLDPDRPYRMRLLLSRDGSPEITTTPLEREPDRGWILTVSAERIDSSEPFHFHKTTRRELYDSEFEKARTGGFDEVLFLNERGEVTQGSRTNVFIRRGEHWLTPPVTSGLLPGVYRQHLLSTLPDVREEPLSVGDLHEADEVLLCNAVRGAVQAALRAGR